MRRPPRGYTDSFRIIGGAHRGRRLGFPPLPGLRPTPDRVRQTVFDWLAPTIIGARGLDLFAGSGALGLEALSRGAAAVTFVEREHTAADAIRGHLETLKASNGTVLAADALGALATLRGPFDVAFVDPPFDSTLRRKTLDALATAGLLAPGARVYLEGPADEEPSPPPGWSVHRSKRAGNVGYHLLVVGVAPTTPT
jgi:16S rRNA (guanine966-N2)-methyltransferase